MRSMLSTLLVAAPLSLAAQTATIDPGMPRDTVIAKLGQPLSARAYDQHEYLLYKNGCEKKCGMNDLVVLDSGKVVDAIFRSQRRKYSGTSSSPRMITQTEARRSNGSPPPVPPATTPETKG